MVDNRQDDTEKELNNDVIEESSESIQEGQTEAQGNESKGKVETPEQEATTETEPGESGSGADAEYNKHVQNWKALRTAREKAERERDDLAARLNRQQQQADNRQVTQDDYRQGDNRQPNGEEQFNLDDDDLVEGKHYKQQRQQTQQQIAALEAKLVEAQLKADYPDFYEVVNEDTIGMLKDTDPELAQSLYYNPDFRSKAVATYKSIKRYGLAKSSYTREKETVNKNISKPRTVTSISPQQAESPLSRANAFAEGLTDEVKARTWKEMQEIMRNS